VHWLSIDEAEIEAKTRECLDRLKESRLRFLVEHLRPNDPTTGATGVLDYIAAQGLLIFLIAAASLFLKFLNLRRREIRVGRTIVPIAEPSPQIFSYITTIVPVHGPSLKTADWPASLSQGEIRRRDWWSGSLDC
jgi:hypothetical protein